MLSKYTILALLPLAFSQTTDINDVNPEDIPPELLDASPSEITSVISSLIAAGVSLPPGIPTDPASIASQLNAASAIISQADAFTNLDPSALNSGLESFLGSVAPTGRLSDLPGIIASHSADFASEFASKLPPAYITAVIENTPAQVSALIAENGVPGSLPLSDFPSYLATGFPGGPSASGSDDEDEPEETGSASGTAAPGGSVTGSSTLATAASGSQSAGASESVGASQSGGASATAGNQSASTAGAAAGGLVGWTGALAGVAMGAVAFL